jgi:4-hydroxybenzoate polyprenyltransferase
MYPYLFLTALVSLLYTMPILGKNRRLRDFNYIKLFLIALVWSITTAFIPSLLLDLSPLSIALISLERFFFFIAITIPFDLRDAVIDEQIQVKTLAHVFDKTNNLRLAILSLFVSVILLIGLYSNGIIAFSSMLLLVISYSIFALVIYQSKNIDTDYYYTGLLDGTMIISYLSVLVGNSF